MKKWLVLICAVMMLTMVSVATAHEVYTSGDWEYILLADGQAEIVKYKGSAENVKIPSRIGELMVTSIGKEAFLDAMWSVRSITIPEGVTEIGERAFAGCYLLRSINFPNSLTHIGADMLLDCSFQIDIQIAPDHPVLEVVDGALFDKKEMRLIFYTKTNTFEPYTYVIPDGICVIDDGAFSHGDLVDENGNILNIGYIVVPDSVKVIGRKTFSSTNNVLIVNPGSYAEQFAIDNSIPYFVVEKEQETIPVKEEDDGSWTCTCGTVNASKFCPECGQKKPEDPQCQSCGYKPEGAAHKFFPECGTKF